VTWQSHQSHQRQVAQLLSWYCWQLPALAPLSASTQLQPSALAQGLAAAQLLLEEFVKQWSY
jgi:hypothetical protein